MRTSNSNAISVRELTKQFGTFVAVDGISFSVRKGEVFGFLGSNGSGKSTTIRMLCGILTPTSGHGTVAGYDLYTETEDIKKSIGYMSQRFSLYEDLTPLENIRFYLGIYTVPISKWEERIRQTLDFTKLHDSCNRLTRELPPGLHQRLALGCAMLHKPDIIILDEPTSGVDLMTRRNFWDFIGELAKRGFTVFVTTHYMDEAVNFHRIAVIDKGRIKAIGSPSEIIHETLGDKKNATFEEAFIKLIARRNN